MGGVKNRHKKFQFDRNRKREWKKSKKLPTIGCDQIRKAWDEKKSMNQNLKDMGLSADPNVSLGIPKAKDLIAGAKVEVVPVPRNVIKEEVVEGLEHEANIPQARRVRLSQPEVRYCIYMMEKYGEDYKAMARDEKNYYQETPKQIKRKITTFKSIPEQYNKYLDSKKKKEMDTS